jgi:hypothetical protein
VKMQGADFATFKVREELLAATAAAAAAAAAAAVAAVTAARNIATLPELTLRALRSALQGWLDTAHPDWRLTAAMEKVVHRDRVEWVSSANVEAWKGSVDAGGGGGGGGDAAAIVGVHGMLLKKSSGVLARWQPRFFAIRGHHLEYAETEEEFQQRSRGIINLRGATQCTRSRGLFVTLKAGGGDGALTLELQAESEELAAAWHEELSKFVDARAAASLQSLEQFAPRKGTLVLGRKVSGGGRAPAAAPPLAAAAAAAKGGGAAAAPAPPTAASSDGSGEDALSAFLAKHGLAGLAASLSELGVEAPADLLDLDEDDVASLGLKKVQVKKWARAIASLKSTATASARARTEL